MITEVLDAIDELVIQEAETVGSICIAINNSYNKMLCIQESEYINNNFGIIFQEGETFDAIKEDVKKKNEGKSTANKIFFTLFRFITSVIDAIRGKLKKMPKSSKPAVEKIEKEDKKIKEDSVKKPTATKKKRVGTEKSVNKGLVCATVGTATVLVATGAVIFGFSKTNKGKADADDTSDIDFNKEFIIEDINGPDMDKTVYTLYDLQELVNSFNGIKSTLKTISGDISKVNSDTFKKDFENISKVFENGRPENKKIDENYIKNKGKKYVIANASSLADNIKDSLEDVAEGLTNIKDGLEKNNTSGTEPDEKISELMKMITQLSGYTDKAAIISENIGDLIQNFAGTEISFEEINGNNSGVKQDKKTESYSDIKTDSDNNEKRSLMMHLVEQLDNYSSIDENAKKTIISDIETEINNGNIKTNADIDTAVKNKVSAKSSVPPKTQPGPSTLPDGFEEINDDYNTKLSGTNVVYYDYINNKIAGSGDDNDGTELYQIDGKLYPKREDIDKDQINKYLFVPCDDQNGKIIGIKPAEYDKNTDEIITKGGFVTENGTNRNTDNTKFSVDRSQDEKDGIELLKKVYEALEEAKNDSKIDDVLKNKIYDDLVKIAEQNKSLKKSDAESSCDRNGATAEVKQIVSDKIDGKTSPTDGGGGNTEPPTDQSGTQKGPDNNPKSPTDQTKDQNSQTESNKDKLKIQASDFIDLYKNEGLGDSELQELNDKIDNGEIKSVEELIEELATVIDEKLKEKQSNTETDEQQTKPDDNSGASDETSDSQTNNLTEEANNNQPTMTLEEMFAINSELAQKKSPGPTFNGKTIELKGYRVYNPSNNQFEYRGDSDNKWMYITYDGGHYIIPNQYSPFAKKQLGDMEGKVYTCSTGFIEKDNKITFAKCTVDGSEITSKGKIE